MDVPPGPRPQVEPFRPSNLQDLDIERQVKQEQGSSASELTEEQLKQLHQEQARRTQANLEDRTIPQLRELMMDSTGEFPELMKEIVAELTKRGPARTIHGIQDAQTSAAAASSSASAAPLTPNKIHKTTDELRAKSVKPGDTETFEVSMLLPEDVGHKHMKKVIEDTYPNCAYEIRGPEELEVEGKFMYKFYIFIQVNISNIGRQAEDKLQYAANVLMIAQGREGDIPTRMMETYHAQLNASPEGLHIRKCQT